ncbi:3 beta-hydroxysteroid dehydrogenase type 7 isoform X3 [Rhineura floridana]|uniref:3 beta-hydroxysteroid dehydrogenase type 7 isoform X3 n=1 Tax=Rhineura floridana TaxID=261503 RepID=UPI002AC7F4FE|nr:3 beta-hydroxysteroid dehydrogenase type 7 isoform X3 [Rhineura floridana]
MEQIQQKYPMYNLVMGGDFNAGTGPNIPNSLILPDLCPGDYTFLPRTSYDKVTNLNGRALYKMMIGLGLVCLNGSEYDSSEGFFTFITKRGASVVDYILIYPQILDLVKNFDIVYRSDSDHLPLSLSLSLSASKLEIQSDKDLFQGPKRGRWSPLVLEEVRSILMSPPLMELRHKATLPANAIIEIFEQIVSHLHSVVTTSKVIPDILQLGNKPWFDKVCLAKKKQVCYQTRFTRLHYSELALAKLYTLKKEYNNLLKYKRSTYVTSFWHRLGVAALNSNQENFWRLVRNSQSDNSHISIPRILPESWIFLLPGNF